MAFSSLQATLLVGCLATAAYGQQNCMPPSAGEKTKDRVFLQQRVVTNSITSNESLWFIPNVRHFTSAPHNVEVTGEAINKEINNDPTLTRLQAEEVAKERKADKIVEKRNQIFKHLLAMVEERENLRTWERTPVNVAVSTLLDALINQSCIYMRTQLMVSDLDCSSVPQMKALLSRLEMIEMAFDHNRIMHMQRDSRDFETIRIDRCTSWKRNVRSPCVADSTCDVNMVDSLYNGQIRLGTCDDSSCY